MDVDKDIKARFSRLLKTCGKTQKEVAKETGIERDTLAQYWIGRTIPPIRHWSAFSALLNVSIEYLATGNENPILKAYYHLPEDDKKIVDKFMFPTGGGREELPKEPPAEKKLAY